MVNNVELDDTVEQLTADKAKVSVNSGQSTLLESPCALLEVLGLVVVVVEVSNGNYMSLAVILGNAMSEKKKKKKTYRASG
jgi:hypothetical protein